MGDLVKVSGSCIRIPEFYNWLSLIVIPANDLFILCGGGDGITEVLNKENISYTWGPRGDREINSKKGKYLAKQVLEEGKTFVEGKLKEIGINATVLIPVEEIDGEIYHFNGDRYLVTLDLKFGFDKIYVVTLKGREKSFPENLKNKVEVIYL
jgi:hypothetical protein